MFSWSDVVTWLAAISSVAVILGVVFIVLQLRQNGRLLEATLRQQRSDVAVSILERLTDESWPKRRSHMFQVVKRFQETDWKDAWESPDDFEIRNFAYIYDVLGTMTRAGLIDIELLATVLTGMVVRDWQAFAPHAYRIRKEFPSRYGTTGDPIILPFSNFEWLAGEASRVTGIHPLDGGDHRG